MHVAIRQHHEESVKTLLFFYPDLTVKNLAEETALYLAATLHAWDLFLVLCQHTEKVDLHYPKTTDSFLVLAFRDRHLEALTWLVEHTGTDSHDKVMQCIV